MNKELAAAEALIKRLDSLADPTRLRLLRLLERQELGVMEICEVLLLPQSTISRHLKILTDQGWLHCRQQGAANWYGPSEISQSEEYRRLWIPVREQSEGWLAFKQDSERLEQILEKRRKEADQFFRKAAAGWDSLRDEMYGRDLTHLAMLSFLSSHWVVADLGCGTGRTGAALASFVKKVIAVDQSLEMLKMARNRMSEFSNAEIRQGDLEKVPIADDECHAALLFLVLSYVAQPEKVITEASRILRPGGRLLIVDLIDHQREDFRRRMGQRWLGFERRVIGRFFRESGLRNHKITILPSNGAAKGPPLFVAWAEKSDIDK